MKTISGKVSGQESKEKRFKDRFRDWRHLEIHGERFHKHKSHLEETSS